MTVTQELIPQSDILDTQAIQQEIATFQHEHVQAQKEALVSSPELRDVITEVTATRGLEADADYEDFELLRETMRGVFDFRTKADGTYGERWEAEENAKGFLENCSPELATKIYSVAEQFGLTGDTEPTIIAPKAALILGGGGKSPLDRTMYAKELIDQGKLNPEVIVAMGSERPVDSAERERAGNYANGANTEYDLLANAVEEAFGETITDTNTVEWTDPSVRDERSPRTHKVAFIEGNDEHPPIVILSSAVVTNPYMTVMHEGEKREILRNRANTEDTFATIARLGILSAGDSAVAITNAHFKPFQGAAASTQLGKHGVMTEVVGFDPAHYDNPAKRSDELLQEMLTTADSLAKG